MEVIEERRKLRRKVIERASSWARGLPFKLTAVLVGSYARGDFNLWSDVDILLISEQFKGGPVDRLRALAIPSGFEVIPLTKDEFRELLKRKEYPAIEAVEIGVVLRDDLKLISTSTNIIGKKKALIKRSPDKMDASKSHGAYA